jgi:hypothetical protein
MSIHEDDQAWLRDSGLVDPEVELDAVQIRTSGPPSWYVSVVGWSAITFGDRFWLREEARRRDIPLIAHELVHVAQYRRYGFAGFLARYVRDFVRHRGYSRELPLEAPAYERADQARRALRG